MTDGIGGALRPVPITLYTDAFMIKGVVETRHRRISDALNEAAAAFLVLADARFDAFRSTSNLIQADYAQVNLASVLFAVSDEVLVADPARVTTRSPEEAMISVPPFTVTGRIHLEPERPLREALGLLSGAFIPVTDATYWSDSLGEARTSSHLVAVNHSRCQILAPHREIDPWAGVAMATDATPEPGDEPTTTVENLGW
jgi:hypothetical protein